MRHTLKIIHGDDSILAIDKPAGIASASLRSEDKNSLAALIIDRYPEQRLISKGELEAGLLHRLDNETSGVLIAARTQEAYDCLRAQFEGREVIKEYLALVIGSPQVEGTITAPIAHHPRKRDRMIACESPARSKEFKGRMAETNYKVISRHTFRKGVSRAHYSLLSVEIPTGVRHQIRVHLAHIGFPIAGDQIYRNSKMQAADLLPFQRQFLHAHRIEFRHPATGEKIEFQSELPKELAKAMERIRN